MAFLFERLSIDQLDQAARLANTPDGTLQQLELAFGLPPLVGFFDDGEEAGMADWVASEFGDLSESEQERIAEFAQAAQRYVLLCAGQLVRDQRRDEWPDPHNSPPPERLAAIHGLARGLVDRLDAHAHMLRVEAGEKQSRPEAPPCMACGAPEDTHNPGDCVR